MRPLKYQTGIYRHVQIGISKLLYVAELALRVGQSHVRQVGGEVSHITCDAERDENAEIFACPHRAVHVWRDVYDDWTGETNSEVSQENQCGKWVTLSPAKDKCLRCGKTFTY